MNQQRFAKFRVLYGGSEVANSLRTFFNGINSRRDISRELALKSPGCPGKQHCMSPHNYADCIANYCDAVLNGETVTACWHSLG